MGESAHNAPIVLVTGGAAGIGRAVADRFLGGGWRVHIGDAGGGSILLISSSAAD